MIDLPKSLPIASPTVIIPVDPEDQFNDIQFKQEFTQTIEDEIVNKDQQDLEDLLIERNDSYYDTAVYDKLKELEDWEWSQFNDNEMPIPKPGWHVRTGQKKIWDAFCKFSADKKDHMGLYYHLGVKMMACMWPRRYGKDETSTGMKAVSMVYRPGIYWHIMPTKTQAIDALFEDFDKYHRIFPEWMIGSTSTTKGTIRLNTYPRQSIIKAMSGERPDGLRGSGVRGMTLSEYAFMDGDSIWKAVRQVLNENRAWANFISTPNGENDFTNKLDHFKKEMDKEIKEFGFPYYYYSEEKLVPDHVPEEEIIKYYRENLGRGPDKAWIMVRQEYYCDRTAGNANAIYAIEMEDIVKNQMIDIRDTDDNGNQLYDPHKEPIHIAMDLGWADGRDARVAYAFNVRKNTDSPLGYEVVIFDWYEGTHDRLNKIIENWVLPNKYHTGYFIMPWDWEQGNAYSAVDDPEDYFYKKYDLDVVCLRDFKSPGAVGRGIQQVKELFASGYCYFDEKMRDSKDGQGRQGRHPIFHLSNYSCKWDTKNNIERPIRNEHTHHGDCIRYLANGCGLTKITKPQARKPLHRNVLTVNENNEVILNITNEPIKPKKNKKIKGAA